MASLFQGPFGCVLLPEEALPANINRDRVSFFKHNYHFRCMDFIKMFTKIPVLYKMQKKFPISNFKFSVPATYTRAMFGKYKYKALLLFHHSYLIVVYKQTKTDTIMLRFIALFNTNRRRL